MHLNLRAGNEPLYHLCPTYSSVRPILFLLVFNTTKNTNKQFIEHQIVYASKFLVHLSLNFKLWISWIVVNLNSENMKILIISFIIINILNSALCLGSCREARLCCPGRDSSCLVQKSPINSIIEDINEDKPCYCDGACITLGDCCHDYKQHCGGQYSIVQIIKTIFFLK